MAIYINKEHPGVFCNSERIPEPNQVEFRRDYLSELIEQQILDNRKLRHSFVHMQYSQNDWNQHQAMQNKQLNKRLNALKELQQQQEAMEHKVIDWLEKIEDQNSILQQTVNYDQRIQNDLAQQVNEMSQSQKIAVNQLNDIGAEHKEIVKLLADFTLMNEAFMSRLEQVVLANEKIETQVEGQSSFNEQLANYLASIEDSQKDVLSRVDNHEGLLEKVIRQIDHLRAIVFERSSYLEEKVEKALQSSAAYLQK